MTIVFERPTGAKRDVQELEYVAALMQTADATNTESNEEEEEETKEEPSSLQKSHELVSSLVRKITGQNGETKPNLGSVSLRDIQLYLKSRHGICVDDETAISQLIDDLGGNDRWQHRGGENDKDGRPLLDLAQIASLIAAPQLLEEDYSHVLERLLQSVASENEDEDDPAPLISRENLRAAFALLGEGFDAVTDDWLDEMVDVAGGDLKTALVADLVEHYDKAWSSCASTNYVDALRAGKKGIANTYHTPSDDEEEATKEVPVISLSHNGKDNMKLAPLTRIFTAPSIDSVADTFKRPLFVMMIWVCAVCLYFAYIFQTGSGSWMQVSCDSLSEVGCTIANGILSWLYIFMQLSTLGVAFIFLGSLGTSVYIQDKIKSVLTLVLGMTALGMFTIWPYFSYVSTALFYTAGNDADIEGDDPFGMGYYVSLGLGLAMMLTQLIDIGYVIVPKKWLARQPRLEGFTTPGTIRAEMALKQAADKKASSMLKNALAYHPNEDDFNERHQSVAIRTENPNVQALINFQFEAGEKETIGGIFGPGKRSLTGPLHRTKVYTFTEEFGLVLLPSGSIFHFSSTFTTSLTTTATCFPRQLWRTTFLTTIRL